MVIEEHVDGYIRFTNGDEFHFDDNNIIDDDISITQQATPDNSFSLGGVYSSTLSMTIRITGNTLNSYNIIGSKVILNSKYGNSSWIRRGVFWVTSAKKYQDIYTIQGSDALIWFDGSIYDDNGDKTLSQNLSDSFNETLKKQRLTLKGTLAELVKIVSNNLSEQNVGNLTHDDGNFVWNDTAPIPNANYNWGNYCITEEFANSTEITSPRDYLSYIGAIAGGFIECKYNADRNFEPCISISRFEDNQDGYYYLNPNNIEFDTLEVADITIHAKRCYVEVYSGATGSSMSLVRGGGKCFFTIDLTGNPFVDGNWTYTHNLSTDDRTCMALLDSLSQLFGDGYYNGGFCVANGDEKTHKITIRPFRCTYHCQDKFHLGQRVMLPYNAQYSVLTKIVWNFRGGYELECSGEDNRVLFDSARRTPSKRAKEEAISKANYLANELNNQFRADMEQQYSSFSGDVSGLQSRIDSVEGDISSLQSCVDGISYDLDTLKYDVYDDTYGLLCSAKNIKANTEKLKEALYTNFGIDLSDVWIDA